MQLVDDRITDNFRLSEFANTLDGNVVLINPDVIAFIQMLQKLRNWYKRVINISSGYRTKRFNSMIGGASNSYHLRGLAADFFLPPEYFRYTQERKNEFLSNVRKKWEELCRADGKRASVIYYDTIVHLSWWPVWFFADKRTKK